MTSRFTEIVKRALTETVTDIGQLSHQEKLDLNYAVRHAWLEKGKGGPFPILKTVYAHKGFDFSADRAAHIAEIMAAHSLDIKRGVSHHFPLVNFQ